MNTFTLTLKVHFTFNMFALLLVTQYCCSYLSNIPHSYIGVLVCIYHVGGMVTFYFALKYLRVGSISLHCK